MKSRRLLIGGLILLAALTAAYAGYRGLTAVDAPTVRVAPLAKGRLESRFLASGEVTVRSSTFAPPDWGMVSAINVHENEAVKAGQLLATLDASGMRSHYLQARAAWASARSHVLEALRYRQLRVTQLESDIAQARADVRGAEAHLQAGGGAEAQANLDKKKAALQGALQAKLEIPLLDERLQAARLDLDMKTEEMHDATTLLRAADMRATTDGVVSQIYLRQGERAGPNNPVLTVVSTDAPWVEAWVDEQEAAGVRVGQPVSVRVSALGGRAFPATVTWVAPALETPQRAHGNARFLHIRVTFGTVAAAPGTGTAASAGNAGSPASAGLPGTAASPALAGSPGNAASPALAGSPGTAASPALAGSPETAASPALAGSPGTAASPAPAASPGTATAPTPAPGSVPPGLRAGMAADVDGRSLIADNVLLLPRAAVIGSGDGTYVMTVSGGRAHRVAVKTGLWTADFAEQLEGPPAGTRIVVEGAERLSDGERIRESPG